MNVFQKANLGQTDGIDITTSKDFMKEYGDIVDNYEIKRGKVSYDLPQAELFKDINTTAGVGLQVTYFHAKDALLHAPIRWGAWAVGKITGDEELYNVLAKQYDEEYKAVALAREMGKKAKDHMNRQLGAETSTTQSFVGGMAFHMLRQAMDLRQVPVLLLSGAVGGAVGGAAASTLPVSTSSAEVIGSLAGNFISEASEELVDQIVNGEEIDKAAILQAGAGAVLLNGIFRGMKKGVGKIFDAKIDADAPKTNLESDVDIATKNAEADYQAKVYEVGNEAEVKIDDLVEIAKHTESPQEVISAGLTINGYGVKELTEEVFPKITNHILEHKLIKGVETEEQLVEYILKHPKKIRKIIRQLHRRKDMSEEIAEAVKIYKEILDTQEYKAIDVDPQKAIEMMDEVEKRKSKAPNLGETDLLEQQEVPKTTTVETKEKTIQDAAKGLMKDALERGKLADGEGVDKAYTQYLVEEALPKVIDYIYENKIFKNWESREELITTIMNNPSKLKKVIRKMKHRKNLSEELKRAVDTYDRVLNYEKMKDIIKEKGEIKVKEVEVVKTDVEKIETPKIEKSEIETENTTTKPKDVLPKEKVEIEDGVYSRELEDPYGYRVEEEVTLEKFEREHSKKDRIDHNSNHFKKSEIEEVARKVVKIPKDAIKVDIRGKKIYTKVKQTKGGKTKTKYNYEGMIFDVMYEHNGYKYHGVYELKNKLDPKMAERVKNGEVGPWKGTMVKVKTEPKNMTKPKIFSEKTTKEKERWASAKQRVIHYFGFDDKVKYHGEEGLKETYKFMIKNIGKIVKKKYNFKNSEEMVKFYKKKYGIDFELKYVKDKGGLGTTIKETRGKTQKITIEIQEGLDFETELGALRHEIQHVIGYKENPNFKASEKPFKIINGEETIAEFFDNLSGEHMYSNPGENWELAYIVSNRIDDLIDKNGKVNIEVANSLDLGGTLPKSIKGADLDEVKGIIKAAKEESSDPFKQLEKLEKDLNHYFTMKRGITSILKGKGKPSVKARMLREYLRTHVTKPFNAVQQKVKRDLTNLFGSAEYQGKQLTPEQLLDLTEKHDFNLMKYLRNPEEIEIPDGLKEIEPQLRKMSETVKELFKDVADGTLIDEDEIWNTLMYDKVHIIEKLLGDEAIEYLGAGKTIDMDKINKGEQVEIPDLDGKVASETNIKISQRFADKYYKLFNSDVDRLEFELNRKKIDTKRLKKAIKKARKCMTLDEFERMLKKYNVEDIAEMREFLENNKNLFKEIENQDMEGAIIYSKKRNAKEFWFSDNESMKGTEENPTRGTHVHKLARFVTAKHEGYISPRNVKKFVELNSVDSRVGINKIVKDVSTSKAIKEVFPNQGSNGFTRMTKSFTKTFAQSDQKTFNTEIMKFLDEELGAELGWDTMSHTTRIDKFVTNFLKWHSKINLSGLKAFREYGYETVGMARDNRMLYGGKGLLKHHMELIRTMAKLNHFVNKIGNEELKGKITKSLAIDVINMLDEMADDITGAKKTRIMKYGSSKEKALFKLSEGLDHLNFYGYTQFNMKTVAYIIGGDNLDRFSKMLSLEDLKKVSHHVKRRIQDLEINETDFKLLKKFKETDTYKRLGIFDKEQFAVTITKEDYIKALGREISDEEFKILKKATVERWWKFNEVMVSDISPTETGKNFARSYGKEANVINRNFQRMTGFFKNSVRVQWERLIRGLVDSNIDPDTNQFDWGNTRYWGNLGKHGLETAIFISALSMASDSEFYHDPLAYIDEKIDNFLDNPERGIIEGTEDYLNIWALATGSTAINHPRSIIKHVSRRDYKKAANSLLKMGIGSYHYNSAKAIKKALDEL